MPNDMNPQSLADMAVGSVGEERTEEFVEGYAEGKKEGKRIGRQDAIDFLQRAYLEDEGRPDRGTPEAKAILQVATDLSNHLKGLPR